MDSTFHWVREVTSVTSVLTGVTAAFTPHWAANLTGQPRGPRTMKPFFDFDLACEIRVGSSIDKRRLVLPADVHEAVKSS